MSDYRDGQPRTAGCAGEEKGSLQSSRGTALLVEDEPSVRAACNRMLEKLGFEVVEAASGTEALEVFQTYRDCIVFVFLDVNMPEMDGLEAFKRLQEEGIDVPVVVCTGYDEYDLARTHAGLGFAGFLAKPFSMNALGNAIERALAP